MIVGSRWALVFCLFFTLVYAQSDIPRTLQHKAEKQHNLSQQPSECIVLGQSKQGQHSYGFAGKLRTDGPSPSKFTLFEIGSISKVFTGILLAETVREGKAAYTDPVSQYLPVETIGENSPLSDLITLESLSIHHSGLPRLPTNLQSGSNPDNPYAHYDKDRLYAYLKTLKKSDLKTHGENAYSNLGVGLLGHLLELIWEKPLPELMHERIFTPLGMSQTFVQTESTELTKSIATGHVGGKPVEHWHLGVLSGAGGIVSCAEDLLIFAEAHWNENTPAGLKAAMQDALTLRKGHQALGWTQTKDKQFSHSGQTGGFQAHLTINCIEKSAEISLMNSAGERLDKFESVGNFSQLEGYWQGSLDLKKDLDLVLHFDTTGRAVIFSINQKCNWSVANRSFFTDDKLTLRFGGIGATFEGELVDNALVGRWNQSGNLPLTLKKIGAKAPDYLKKRMAKRITGDLKQLEGYWSGYIGFKQLFVIMHVLPIGEELWIVDFYSPTQTQPPFPASEFSCIKQNIEGKWSQFDSKLKATIDNKTLKGVWSQGFPQPITLQWSHDRPKPPTKE